MVEIINGVVLRTIKYSDNLMIADIYTLQHGRRSFLLPVTRSKRSRVRSVLFQPLSIITFSASTNARSLARISDAQPLLLYSTIPYDVVKSSIALYLAEVLTYALHEQQSDGYDHNHISYTFLHLLTHHLRLKQTLTQQVQ